jgi:hypothetical protein
VTADLPPAGPPGDTPARAAAYLGTASPAGLARALAQSPIPPALQPPASTAADGDHAALVRAFLFHYAQAAVWMNEALRLTAGKDSGGARLADQHALGHALHVAHARERMPTAISNAVQARANQLSAGDGNGRAEKGPLSEWVPTAWLVPQPAGPVPVNGGGLNGDAMWYPPGHQAGDARTAPGATWRRGDRVVLVFTSDPHTRLRPGDTGTVTRWDPATGQLGVKWNSGSTLALLLYDGDEARPAPAPVAAPAPDAPEL